jgi:pimeloyl-ACP methyl ester carboxylesterase
MVNGKSREAAAEIIVRGATDDTDEKNFKRAILEEIRKKAGITDTQLAEIAGQAVVTRGPTNWKWFQTILKAVDRFVPHGSGASIALFTNDVYQYLKNSVIRETIDEGVSAAIAPGIETVVVAHSLGTVVAYNLLRQAQLLRNWRVPLLVTVGSPLAVTKIRATLRNLASIRCPECVGKWFNAMDERDVVALYPLDTDQFPLDPVDPAIENKRDVLNKTSNRHGIAGYLDDKEVAKRIHDALTS